MDIRVEQATVTAKDIQSLKKGDIFIPSHRLAFCVIFTLESGETIMLEVPEDKFDAFTIGDTQELAWQSYMILSFGNLEFTTYP